MFPGLHWFAVKDGSPAARSLCDRHYTRRKYRDGHKPKFTAGPGQKMILLTSDESALFVWRKSFTFNGQTGVNCAVFRNESQVLSSQLILEAEALAWQRWPGERLYTYINPKKIRSTNPGYCFKCAGWQPAGFTKKLGLLILEKYPNSES